MSLIFLFSTLSNPVLAVDERSLANGFHDDIFLFYKQEMQKGKFIGMGDIAISYAKYEVSDDNGAIIISSGRAEFLTKYAELIFDLRNSGYSIYIMDHRGQGESGRILDDPRKGHVELFNNYIHDFSIFIDSVVQAKSHPKNFIIAHSMGGTIAILYAGMNPGNVHGIILSSPMLMINSGIVPESFLFNLARILNTFGLDEAYVPGGAGYDMYASFAGNSLTHSLIRFDITRQLLAKDSIHTLGSPTNRWLSESINACRQARAVASFIKIPILLLQAGNDSFVKNNAQDVFCQQSHYCTKVAFDGARHEILMENDEIRNKAISSIQLFLALQKDKKN